MKGWLCVTSEWRNWEAWGGVQVERQYKGWLYFNFLTSLGFLDLHCCTLMDYCSLLSPTVLSICFFLSISAQSDISIDYLEWSVVFQVSMMEGRPCWHPACSADSLYKYILYNFIMITAILMVYQVRPTYIARLTIQGEGPSSMNALKSSLG